MTDLGSMPFGVDTTHAYNRPAGPRGWAGWISFGAFMMIVVGSFQLIQGFTAIFNRGFYVATKDQVFDLDYSVWGWGHVLLGAVIMVSGLGVLAGNVVARVVAIVVLGLSALANMMFIAAYPFWSVTIITVDILVIYALTVHGSELRNPD
jgi:hypothetical protein